MKKETAYRVDHNDNYCVVFLLSDALHLIKTEIEENYTKEDEFQFELSVIEMTEEEIENEKNKNKRG